VISKKLHQWEQIYSCCPLMQMNLNIGSTCYHWCNCGKINNITKITLKISVWILLYSLPFKIWLHIDNQCLMSAFKITTIIGLLQSNLYANRKHCQNQNQNALLTRWTLLMKATFQLILKLSMLNVTLSTSELKPIHFHIFPKSNNQVISCIYSISTSIISIQFGHFQNLTKDCILSNNNS